MIRASVTAQATGQPLSGALLRVERTSDATYLAGGISDSRGEALVAIPGIPVTTWEEGSGPVLTNEVGATLIRWCRPTLFIQPLLNGWREGSPRASGHKSYKTGNISPGRDAGINGGMIQKK